MSPDDICKSRGILMMVFVYHHTVSHTELLIAPERFSQRSAHSKSSRSSGSSSSSVRSRLAKAAAKAATFQIEMDFIDREAEHKRQKMLKEIAKAKAEEKAMKKLEEELALKETISTHQNNDMEAYFETNKHRVINVKESGQPRHVERRVLNSSLCIHKDNLIKQEFVPEQIDPALLESQQDGFIPKVELNKTHDNSNDKQQNETGTVGSVLMQLAKQQVLNSLPQQQPPVFSGNYFDYPYFVSAFDSLIEAKVDDLKQRLYFLNQFTSGEAREMIKVLVTLNSPGAYSKARNLLKEPFGHPYRVAQAYK